VSFFASSPSDEAPIAFSWTNSSIALCDMSKTAHSCPAFRSLRTMLAPILPSPIIPSCILLFFLCAYLLQFKNGVCRFENVGVHHVIMLRANLDFRLLLAVHQIFRHRWTMSGSRNGFRTWSSILAF
jgi:hypothetical protein